MREKLQRINGKRKTFSGIFERFGTKTNFKGFPERTILLKDIKCATNEEISADHAWFNFTKEFSRLDLQEGDKIQFDARVKEYEKGYKGYDEDRQLERPIEKDYKLSHPTRIGLVRRKHKKSQTQLKTP